jgi:hypothetical protein
MAASHWISLQYEVGRKQERPLRCELLAGRNLLRSHYPSRFCLEVPSRFERRARRARRAAIKYTRAFGAVFRASLGKRCMALYYVEEGMTMLWGFVLPSRRLKAAPGMRSFTHCYSGYVLASPCLTGLELSHKLRVQALWDGPHADRPD